MTIDGVVEVIGFIGPFDTACDYTIQLTVNACAHTPPPHTHPPCAPVYQREKGSLSTRVCAHEVSGMRDDFNESTTL